MLPSNRAARAREMIAKIAGSGLEPHELLYEVSERVRAVVPFELGGFVTLDQDSLIPTSCVGMGPSTLARDLLRNEVVTPDVHKFADVSRRARPVMSIAARVDADANHSLRHQTIFAPLGLDSEARVVFRTNGWSWGGAGLARQHGDRPFDADELSFLAEITDDVGRGLRRSLLRVVETTSEQPPTGVMILDEHLRTVSANTEAEQWRDLMPAETHHTFEGTALAAQGLPAGDSKRRVRVRLKTGGWLAVHASPLASGEQAPRLTAVTLEPVRREERVQLMSRLHGLTARESEVAELACTGRSTDQMTSELFISGYTLRDHLKSIFAKVGVANRPALMAKLAGDPPL